MHRHGHGRGIPAAPGFPAGPGEIVVAAAPVGVPHPGVGVHHGHPGAGRGGPGMFQPGPAPVVAHPRGPAPCRY